MYSLMLVEDEPIVLEGMLKIIDFNALGFEVVCSCGNGVEAIEYYNKYHPDVVITDICMEYMDGLEFIENVSHECTETKFVIISGYQDFKFFKKALSLKVTDYILKPVTAKEFRELLERIATEIGEKNDKGSGKQLEEYLEVEKMMFFNKLMHIQISKEEIEKKLEMFGIEFSQKFFQVAMFRLNDFSEVAKIYGFKSPDELLNDMYRHIQKDCLTIVNSVVFIDPQGCILLLLNDDSKAHMTNWIKQLSAKYYTYYRNNNMGYMNCYMGFLVDNIAKIVDSYKSANRLHICGVLNNAVGYYDSEEILFVRANRTYDYVEPMNNWIRSIIFGEESAIHQLNEILENFHKAGYLLTDFRIAAIRMMDILLKELELINKKISDKKCIMIEDHMTENQISSNLLEITEYLINDIENNSDGKESYIAKKGIHYIEENYGDINLDLQQVCSWLNISISYFSLVFKKYSGKTFVKYLNSYRIEKAKYYLEYTQKSITEISEYVGYIDPHYFGIVFKKYTGTTPKKYRAMLRK